MLKTHPKKGPDILIVNDEELLHTFYKKIQEGLQSQGHDVKLQWLEDLDDLKSYLKKHEKSRDSLPRMILLDVYEVGAPAAKWVANWFKTHHPDHPLPPISFLSLDNTMAITEVRRLRRDTEINAEVVSVDELQWLTAEMGDQHYDKAPYSTTLRRHFNDWLGTDFSLESDGEYSKALGRMPEAINDDILREVRMGRYPSDKAISRLRPFAEGVATAIENNLYVQKKDEDQAIAPDLSFYESTGFPVKGPVVFSPEDVWNWVPASGDRPVLLMQSYDPKILPLLGSGKLGGVIIQSPYMASHIKFLCEANMVTGIFGLKPSWDKGYATTFNERARPELPPYVMGETATLGKQKIAKGQELIIALAGRGVIADPGKVRHMMIPDMGGDNLYENRQFQKDIAKLVELHFCFGAYYKNKGLAQPLVKANADSPQNPLLAHAPAIGLVRTEQITAQTPAQYDAVKALWRGDLEQVARQNFIDSMEDNYRQFLSYLKYGKQVKIRLFDLAPEEILNLEEQRVFRKEYKTLDIRGGKALAAWPELYQMQARAIFSAFGQRRRYQPALQIMMPAVRSEADVLAAEAIVKEAAKEAGIPEEAYEFGVMIETLEACQHKEAILSHCDFISFGTNDLTQEYFNVPRGNLMMREDLANKLGFDPFLKLAPEVGKLVAEVCKEARRKYPRMEIDVCGAQAAEPATAVFLIENGVNNISVAPSAANIFALAVRLNYALADRLSGQQPGTAPQPGQP